LLALILGVTWLAMTPKADRDKLAARVRKMLLGWR